MPPLTISTVLQLLLGLGLLNVWLVRPASETPFRGGGARSLKEEFAVYGLPAWFFYVVGTLKVGAAIALLAGLWAPSLVLPAGLLLALLMLGALAMHLKVQDPTLKSVPAFLMLTMSAALSGIALS